MIIPEFRIVRSKGLGMLSKVEKAVDISNRYFLCLEGRRQNVRSAQ
jgi:hypothetical protein